MLFTPFFALLAMLPAAFSAPATDTASTSSVNLKSIDAIKKTDFKNLASNIPKACTVNNISVPLNGLAGLSVPAGQVVSAIAVGRGTQNYTCTSGSFVSAGAVADLFDVSCLYSLSANFVDPNKISDLLPKMALSALPYPQSTKLPIAMHHQFITTPGSTTAGAISPEFATKSDKVVVSRAGGVNDPVDPVNNVAWLQLAALQGQGSLSKSVFRLNTAKGQPPTLCTTEGQKLQVQYAAMYWFTK